MLNIEKMLKEILFCIAQYDMGSFDNEYRNKYLQDIETLKRALIINYDLSENTSTRVNMTALINKINNIKSFIERMENK